jgi:hypothetical protein
MKVDALANSWPAWFAMASTVRVAFADKLLENSSV